MGRLRLDASALLLASGAVAAAATLTAFSVSLAVIARFTLLVFCMFFCGCLLTPRRLAGAEAASAALAMGISVAGLFWAAALFLGLPPRLSLVALAALAVIGVVVRRATPLRVAPAVVAAAIVCGATIAWTQFGNAEGKAGEGLVFRNTYAREALFHCAIAQEVRHSLVVQLPAGVSLPYHVGYHLLAALTVEATGASMPEVNYRLLPALLGPGIALAAAGFAQAWGAAPTATAAASLFLFLADDLSWIFGVAGLGDPRASGTAAWDVLLGAPVIYALHHNRGFLAGGLVFFPALSLLGRYLRDGGRAELFAGGALAAALIHYKISFFVILAAALGLVTLASVLRADDRRTTVRRCLAADIVTATFAGPLLLPLILLRPGGDATGFAPFPVYLGLLALVKLGAFPDWDSLTEAARAHPVGFALRWLPPAILLFTLGTLGSRLIALRELAGRLRLREGIVMLTAGAVAAGFGMGVALSTPPARSNIAYFWGTALLLLAVLSGVCLCRVARRASRGMAFVAAVVGLSLPGTLQLLWVERSVAVEPVLQIPEGVVEAGEYLAAHATPGDVLLEPDVRLSALAALAPVRPVMAWADWLRVSLGKDLVQGRIKEVRGFFGGDDTNEKRRLLDRYRVRWVWAPRGTTAEPPESTRVLDNSAGGLWRVDLKVDAPSR